MPSDLRPGLTKKALEESRRRFVEEEPRDLFYRAASVLIADSKTDDHDLDLAESLAVLLQTWNVQFYRFRKGFKQDDLKAIRAVLHTRAQDLEAFGPRTLDTFESSDEAAVTRCFHDFEAVLGPVGAAKALHLLAPKFFPIWDHTIASEAYPLRLRRIGNNDDRYLGLMSITKAEIEALGGWSSFEVNPVKAIDEYNYCTYVLDRERN